ncbi:biotin--[acetyl-CoA-carboxylase] ligase [Parachlamydia sp. AcF125]|uniref:biotin--[acetyl-CoA-carboxylase] ligase n=1 Tax=Parachlamydia sp. AcF125 TaxID=2795736 RepID=UPI001BC9A033|nr:biotin--[acetyl-CoA-carboxylase] ligase [Parachlamydia sp. AcF125]MBS4168231.1 Bifunctional ligase/repressor BirA [Parachlamydia sp. AcF125]
MKIVQYRLNTVSSTNTWAKEHLHQLDREGVTLVTADVQTAGRGRLQRSWFSPPSQNIYASFCFFIPHSLRASCCCLAQISALFIDELIQEQGLIATIKWPNDLLIQSKKVAGILVETCVEEAHLMVILGIGLNVNMSEDDLLLIGRPATSLRVEANKTFDREGLLQDLQAKFLRDYDLFLKAGFSPFFEKYAKKVQGLIGKEMTLNQGHEQWRGVIEALTEVGFLQVRLADGSLKVASSAELL